MFLEHNGKEVMVSCGGGIVETEPARKVLASLASSKGNKEINKQTNYDKAIRRNRKE
jgi:hypothetical protein